MLILADNDVGGAVTALRRVLESAAWGEFTATLELRFVAFADVGLARDASDRTVWSRCQEVGAVLITGNRASRGIDVCPPLSVVKSVLPRAWTRSWPHTRSAAGSAIPAERKATIAAGKQA